MISKKIQHPLRTIEIAYNELKPLHPMEEEMLERYTRLHNFVKELQEEYNDVQLKYELHNSNICRVISRFRAIKTRMNHLGDTAKRTVNLMVPDKEQADKAITEYNEFKELLQDFHMDLQRLAGESDSLFKVFIPLDAKDERLTEIFKEYKEFREGVYDNTDSYSLDIAQYNHDEQAFFGSLTDMAGRQTEFIDVCNRVIDRYNLLVEEVEKTYDQWEQYSDMIDMIQLMTSTPHDISKICLN